MKDADGLSKPWRPATLTAPWKFCRKCLFSPSSLKLTKLCCL